MVIYSGFTHWKWWFSIAMLNYQRVNGAFHPRWWMIFYRSSWENHRTNCWKFHLQDYTSFIALNVGFSIASSLMIGGLQFFLPLVGLNTWRMDHFGGWYILNMLIPPDFIGQYVPTHRNPVLNPYFFDDILGFERCWNGSHRIAIADGLHFPYLLITEILSK